MKTILTSTLLLGMSLISIASEKPAVQIEADKQEGYLPLTVKFRTVEEEENPQRVYKWDFGNGNTSTLKSPSSSFVNPGTYNVQLVVTTINGGSDTTQMQVNVLPNPDLINNLMKTRASNE